MDGHFLPSLGSERKAEPYKFFGDWWRAFARGRPFLIGPQLRIFMKTILVCLIPALAPGQITHLQSTGRVSRYSISGKVIGSTATLTLSGTASGQTKTDASGNYSFSNLTKGSYLVAPSQSGYAFSPSTAAETIKNTNINGVNFTAAALPVQHSVALSWTASTSSDISGYKVYRGTVSGGPYTLISSSLIGGTAYIDSSVSAGLTYYYVATAVDSGNVESGYSDQAVAIVPTP
jgi:hypothetical protein